MAELIALAEGDWPGHSSGGDVGDPDDVAIRGARAAGTLEWHAYINDAEADYSFDDWALMRIASTGQWGGAEHVGAQVYASSYGLMRRVVPVAETTATFGAHIAHAHPGRVRAWLGCVARLRERVAEGHALECEIRMPTMMALARGEPGECDCGHDLDLAALGAVDAEG